MDELKAEVDSVYAIISALQVSGDAVDVMAAVRSKLRKIRSMADSLTKQEAEKDG